jgi:AcrR family transcriptional regulator
MSDTSNALARAALEFIDENGVDALTIRALGQAVDMHHTAVYRHYRNKNDLLRSVLALVIDDAMASAGPLPEDPEEKLISLIRGFRAALGAHPAITIAYLAPVESLSDSESSTSLQQVVVDALRQLGLHGRELLVHYQLLESYTLGACVFDFGGAPDHIGSRRRRHKMMSDPDFAVMSRSDETTQAITESAFELGLVTLVKICAAAGLAASSSSSSRQGAVALTP